MTERDEMVALADWLDAGASLAMNHRSKQQGEAAARYLREIAARTDAGYVVKPLEWTQKPPPGHDHEPFVYWAAGIGGHYKADRDGTLWLAHDAFVWEPYETQKAAKAAAQADYEQRIRSALIVQPFDAGNDAWLREQATALWAKLCTDCVHSRTEKCDCLDDILAAFSEIAALPAPGNEATEEQVAREICLSYGRDPDEPSDPMEMCDANNQPVPTWRIYEEQAGDLLSTFTVQRKSQSEERL